jgi:hypothetical protein
VDVVPSKIKSPIDFVVLGLIIGAAIGVQFLFMSLPEDELGNTVFIGSLISSASVATAAFIIAKRYWGTKVFGKSYLAFALGYLAYFIAEVLYYTFDLYLGIEPYPSVADIFFFALYPFSLIHLILNIRFFNPKFSVKQKAWLIAVPAIIFFIYSYTTLIEYEEPSFDYFYGIIFVLGASTVFAFAVLGASVFRKGVLGVAWLLLVCGILISTVGDVWYYYLEVFEEYSDLHPVNVMWYVSDFLIIYALAKHRKIF